MSDLPDLMDTAAVAERLGVARSTISTYLARGRMPQPDLRLGGGPVWRRETIEAWIETRPGQGHGGGRPRTPACHVCGSKDKVKPSPDGEATCPRNACQLAAAGRISVDDAREGIWESGRFPQVTP